MHLYKITFPNKKSYIGITSRSAKRRAIVHLSHARTGRNYPIHRAIRKYGEKSFTIQVLMVCNDWDYLCETEIRAIAAYGTVSPRGYNLALGGSNGMLGRPVSAETRAKISIRMKQKAKTQNGLPGRIGNQFAKGYRHTDESKMKIALAGTGVVFSDERRARIGAKKRGNQYCLGRPCSEETRRKISESQKGKPRPWTQARRDAQKSLAPKC